jgi:hypothetical protein
LGESLSEPIVASRARILKATAIAFAVAVVLLVVAVLPAEYGIDPVGTGRLLGLTALAGVTEPAEPRSTAPTPSPASFREDVYKVELRPFEGVEYKYRLESGAGLVYSWEASAPVKFEFHGEPDGAPAKFFDSYSKGKEAHAQGGFTAEKPGIHGWFWENPDATRVTITLRTAGFYSRSIEFRDGERIERKFVDR